MPHAMVTLPVREQEKTGKIKEGKEAGFDIDTG